MRVAALMQPDWRTLTRPVNLFPRMNPQKWAEFYSGIHTWGYRGTIDSFSFSGTFRNLSVESANFTGPANEVQILNYLNTSFGADSGFAHAAFFFRAAFYLLGGYYFPLVGSTITTSTRGVTTQITDTRANEFSGSILGVDMGPFYGLSPSDDNVSGFVEIVGEQWWEYRDAGGENPKYNQNDGTPITLGG